MWAIDEVLPPEAPEIPVLLTSRLKLRHWKKLDLEVLSSLHKNLLVTEFFSSIRVDPFSFDEMWQTWFRNGFGMWAVADRKTDQFVGSIGLSMPGNWPNPEISWIFDPHFWGQGLATEAAIAVVEFAFGQLELDQLISVCLTGNRRSERVMQKLGMTPAEYMSEEPLIRVYGLNREEWQLQSLRDDSTIR